MVQGADLPQKPFRCLNPLKNKQHFLFLCSGAGVGGGHAPPSKVAFLLVNHQGRTHARTQCGRFVATCDTTLGILRRVLCGYVQNVLTVRTHGCSTDQQEQASRSTAWLMFLHISKETLCRPFKRRRQVGHFGADIGADGMAMQIG